MIDDRDTRTGDLLPKPRQRGRPTTGVEPASAAKRKQEQRKRDKDAKTYQAMTTTGLIELLSQTMAECTAMHKARKKALEEGRSLDNSKRLGRAVEAIRNIMEVLMQRAHDGVGHD